ncbi:hypothetical protein Ancab_003926 [Ancistrocladus abbreviatus]
MDFGLVGIESLVGQDNSGVSEQEAKTKRNGSAFVKQERSAPPEEEEEDCRASKVARAADDLSLSKTMSIHQGTPLLRSNPHSQPQMLRFSSPKPEVSFLSKDDGLVGDKSSQNMCLSYYQHTPSSYTRNAGHGSGSLNGSNTHGSFTGIRGPFTPAQWIELEHQAMIYKYLAANLPVPTSLLIPIRKALNPSGYSGFSACCFPSHSYGWGSFHLGFSGNTDPEPGRCRRTDGKKWRCSRDAVPDQKYCERHMNRGRHRSRKPVEGQTGQAATGTTNTKVALLSSSATSLVTASGSASNSLGNAQHHQLKGLQPGATNPSTDPISQRLQESQGLSVMTPSIDLKSKDSPFAIPRQDISFDPSQSEFGFVSSDSLLNPSQKTSYLNCKNYNLFLDYNGQQTQDDHTLRRFMDDWPKDQSSRSTIAWGEELKSDWTQLSMSIPISSDFSSSSSSPNQEKITLSPLRLSRELEPAPMGLGVGSILNESSRKQGNWVPISWGNSMGGPLAEVLNNTGSSMGTYKSASASNLTSERWDGSPQLGSSPTDVLQKVTFVSLSNSSSGSSPTAENKKTQEGACLCNL